MAIVEDQISFARVEDGEDGRGIKGTPVSTYAQSTSGTTPPTTWSDTRPNVPVGQYLWTRVVTTYTDNTTSETQTPTLMGEVGDPGVSVTGTQVQFVQTSSTTEPTSGWSTTRPTPVPGQWLWTRSRNILSDGGYGAWVTVPTLIGREAIVVSATAPSNPSTGTLWQTPTGPNVQKWDGTKWVDWGISVDNLVAENITIVNGKFEVIEGVKVKAGTIDGASIRGDGLYSDFDVNADPGGTNRITGRLSMAEGKFRNDYQYKDGSGAVYRNGYMTLNNESLQMVDFDGDQTTTPSRVLSLNAFRMGMTDSQGRGGNLTFQDLYNIGKTGIPAASGWSQYSTSPSSGNFPSATRLGRMVQVSGAFKNNSTLPNTNDTYVVGVLPVGFRPQMQVKYLGKGAGTTIFMVTIDTNGEISISYRLGWTGSSFGYLTNNANDIFNIAGVFSAADV